jgi:hypothetical protein
MSDMTLLEWASAYIKYKDTVRGKIQSMIADDKNSKVDITNKDGTKEVMLCAPLLETLNISNLKDEKIACLNKKENVTWLINNWDTIKDKRCIFHFVNLKRSENWAINPYMHHSVTDKSALKPGLKALFESIPEAD